MTTGLTIHFGRGSRIEPVNGAAAAIFFQWPSCTRIAATEVYGTGTPRPGCPRRADGYPWSAPITPACWPKSCTSWAKSKSSSGCGRLSCWPWSSVQRLGGRHALFQRDVNFTEPLFVVVIMALASTRPVVALRRSARCGASRTRGGGTPGGVVARRSYDRPAARLLHHRAGRDDDLRAAARAPVLRPRAEPAAEVRDARPAVRQHLDRRHAHAFRGAAGADGGAAVGLGHAFMLAHFGWRALRRRSSCRRSSISLRSAASSQRWRRCRRVRTSNSRMRKPRRADTAADPRGLPSSIWHSWRGRSSTPTIRRSSSVASCSSSASRGPRPPTRAASSFKTPLLVGFFLAGLVIHGGLQGWWIAPVLARLSAGTAVPRRIDPDGVQRQRARSPTSPRWCRTVTTA